MRLRGLAWVPVVLTSIWASLASPQAWAGKCQVALLPGAFETSSFVGRFLLSEDDYFKEYREFFERKGCGVLQMRFPADATVEQRGFLIRNRLMEGGPWWVIAHSQSGLDLRFAFETLRLNPKQVLGVVSIGTPHGGSRVASWALDHQKRQSWLARGLRMFGYDLEELRFLPEMDAAFLQEKSKYFAQSPPVRWYAALSECRSHCHVSLRVARWLVGASSGDGLVELESQRFGEPLGPFDLDHLSEVGVDALKRPPRQHLLEAVWEKMSGSF